jgi:hypothetical protein
LPCRSLQAFDRLERDGAHSSDALRRRVRALAQKRNIPPADFAKLMYKRINTRDVMALREAQGKLRLVAGRRFAGFAQDDPGGESHAA